MSNSAFNQAADLIQLSTRLNLTLGIAESLTGGMISSVLTDVPGASAVLNGAVVSYSNDLKMSLLNVSPLTLQNFGAVSEICAREMATGSLKLLKSDCSLASTGIAGPGGATTTKPVGLVYLAVALKNPDICEVRRFTFSASLGREGIKLSTVIEALSFLNDLIKRYY